MQRMQFVWLSCLAVVAGCAHPPTSPTTRAMSSPQSEEALAELTKGTKLVSDGKFDQAEKHLQAALDADAFSGLAHNNLGTVYYEQGRLYDAAWQFQYAAKLLPSHPQPHNNLGLVLETTGKIDEAIAEYQQAIALQPDNPQFIGNLARAHVRRGDRDPETRQLLQDLCAKETRPNWREWAGRELAIRYPAAGPSTVPAVP